MNNNLFVGIMTGIGFCLAAWSYPLISPILNKVLNPTYKCNVQYLLPENIPQERTTEVLKSDLKVGNYIKGFKVDNLQHFDNQVIAFANHPVYNDITINCKEE